MKLKKRKKYSRMHGRRTCGYSAKLHKGSGNKGGKGMAGTGKRADQKKTLVIRLYGNKYFGKQGITSRKTAKKKRKFINLENIEKKFSAGEIDLSEYKILGNGEISKKFVIKAKAASASAIEKIKKAGGEIILKPSLKKKLWEERKTEKKKEDKTEKIESKGK